VDAKIGIFNNPVFSSVSFFPPSNISFQAGKKNCPSENKISLFVINQILSLISKNSVVIIARSKTIQ